jgi:tetratricopeptide (TPR) repeat protein
MRNLIFYSVLLLSLATFAQEKDNYLPKANDEFVAKKYADAEANYRISISKAPTKAIASYNLGNSIYKQNQASEAKFAYLKAIENTKTRPEKHQAFHNLGNVFMKEKNYTQAVEAYKNALRNNPQDEETRYNYALAKKMLKENPPKDDKKKDKKDKKDDKKDQDKIKRIRIKRTIKKKATRTKKRINQKKNLNQNQAEFLKNVCKT